MARCELCQRDCDLEELRQKAGKLICEDCFLEEVEITRVCDPWAVHSAKRTLPDKGPPPLTPLQQQLYDLIQREKEVPPAEAARRLGISESELQRQIATLRHLELVRAAKTPTGVVFTLFAAGDQADVGQAVEEDR